jgi:hypothetical protein
MQFAILCYLTHDVCGCALLDVPRDASSLLVMAIAAEKERSHWPRMCRHMHGLLVFFSMLGGIGLFGDIRAMVESPHP